MNRICLALAACLIVLLFAVRLPALPHDEDEGPSPIWKIDKKGEVKIGIDTQVGEWLLKKGTYLVEHRAQGDSHVHLFTFTRIEKPKKGAPAVVSEKIEVASTVIPTERIKNSAVHTEHEHDKDIYRVTKIEIAGENFEHFL